MFEKLLTSVIAITVQMYINLKLKEALKSINKKGKYSMKVTSKIGGFSLSAIVKECPVKIVENEITRITSPEEIFNLNMTFSSVESEVEMYSEEFSDVNKIVLEDIKHFRETILVPFGTAVKPMVEQLINMAGETMAAQTARAQAPVATEES